MQILLSKENSLKIVIDNVPYCSVKNGTVGSYAIFNRISLLLNLFSWDVNGNILEGMFGT